MTWFGWILLVWEIVMFVLSGQMVRESPKVLVVPVLAFQVFLIIGICMIGTGGGL